MAQTTDLKKIITNLKAKLKKAEAEIKSLKASKKTIAAKAKKDLEVKLEKIFNHGYSEAMKDMQQAEDAYEKYMNKAAVEFENKILPKLKKTAVCKNKKSSSKTTKAKCKCSSK